MKQQNDDGLEGDSKLLSKIFSSWSQGPQSELNKDISNLQGKKTLSLLQTTHVGFK